MERFDAFSHTHEAQSFAFNPSDVESLSVILNSQAKMSGTRAIACPLQPHRHFLCIAVAGDVGEALLPDTVERLFDLERCGAFALYSHVDRDPHTVGPIVCIVSQHYRQS